ncbi:MAG: release factor glutamine methyltransferase [Solirubrobacteraceae bacterium]|jgi:release factor glutamine methyltransferase|nr:release factor glutamine methyltransferase [Solirubrobacteraceae bacterium]
MTALPSAPPATVREVLASADERLAYAGCRSPRLDAELLLCEVLGVERAPLVADASRALSADEAEAFEALVARREAREPVAYILGRKGFRHIDLHVDSRVLIPRPDTEPLVEAALDLPAGSRVVELGTGSGAVALALKHERPDLQVTATDLDAGALDVARANARRLGLDVTLRHADLLAGAGGPFDAVLANLPYVDVADYVGLDPEISTHEPRLAVVAGESGFALIRRLIGQLRRTPFVALEVGLAQDERVADMLRGAGYAHIETRRDLAGIERVVVGRREPRPSTP